MARLLCCLVFKTLKSFNRYAESVLSEAEGFKRSE
jgi:hypothetical protein